MRTKKIVYAGVLLAIGLLLPQLFHLSGIPQSGAVFLPMHIPVLLAGFMLGPVFGLCIGIILPIVSFLFTGMPPFIRMPVMAAELAGYGFISGLFFHHLGFCRKKLGTYIALIIALAGGRLIYAIALLVSAYIFGVDLGAVGSVVTAAATGAIGIIIQLILIPVIIYSLKKGGFLDGFITAGKKAS